MAVLQLLQQGELEFTLTPGRLQAEIMQQQPTCVLETIPVQLQTPTDVQEPNHLL